MVRRRLIAVGASTGGTEALVAFLSGFPAKAPPILIVQHMPKAYTGSFADRLNDLSSLSVREAKDIDTPQSGLVLLAPGDRHLKVIQTAEGVRAVLSDEAPVSRHRPSVDVLFRSMADVMGRRGIGVILTGMGSDGAKGLKAMRDAGARTFGQDEGSCVVYGMPKAAKHHGAVQTEASLKNLPNLVQDSYRIIGAD
ncbi:MAG: CheB methylesterase domain-containing protein [Pseudomonadota bacterium]